MAVKFEDYSLNVKAAINDTTLAWLHDWAHEITSHMQRNCKMDDNGQLRGSYTNIIDDAKGKATIGTPLESGFWEEFGTGEHADTGKNGGKPGRKGWWVYSDEVKGDGGKTRTEAQAKDIAASDPTLHATNGREPNYTVENAFKDNRNKAEADLKRRLKGMGE